MTFSPTLHSRKQRREKTARDQTRIRPSVVIFATPELVGSTRLPKTLHFHAVPKATSALIDIESALALRVSGQRPVYRCAECRELVRPHRKGTTEQAAHFEHLRRNPICSLSD